MNKLKIFVILLIAISTFSSSGFSQITEKGLSINEQISLLEHSIGTTDREITTVENQIKDAKSEEWRNPVFFIPIGLGVFFKAGRLAGEGIQPGKTLAIRLLGLAVTTIGWTSYLEYKGKAQDLEAQLKVAKDYQEMQKQKLVTLKGLAQAQSK